MQMNGPQAPAKPNQFNEEQTAQLAAYVASLGAGPAIPEDEYLDVNHEDVDITRGGDLFRINCAMCHNAAAAGGALTRGKYAPSLQGVDEKHIYEAMETGPQNMPVFSDSNIKPRTSATSSPTSRPSRTRAPRRPHPRLARPRLRGPVHLDRGPGADHRLHGLAHQPILLIPSAQARRPPVIDIHHSSKGNRTYGRERL